MIKRWLILILAVGLMVGCGTRSTPTPQPTAKPTDEPLPTPTEESMEAVELPEDVAKGKVLFSEFIEEVGFACATCHYTNSDTRLLGPGLLSIEERFADYDVDVDTVELYIKQSILNPGVFIVPDDAPYPENLMPRNYASFLSDDDLDKLITYILSF